MKKKIVINSIDYLPQEAGSSDPSPKQLQKNEFSLSKKKIFRTNRNHYHDLNTEEEDDEMNSIEWKYKIYRKHMNVVHRDHLYIEICVMQ